MSLSGIENRHKGKDKNVYFPGESNRGKLTLWTCKEDT